MQETLPSNSRIHLTFPTAAKSKACSVLSLAEEAARQMGRALDNELSGVCYVLDTLKFINKVLHVEPPEVLKTISAAQHHLAKLPVATGKKRNEKDVYRPFVRNNNRRVSPAMRANLRFVRTGRCGRMRFQRPLMETHQISAQTLSPHSETNGPTTQFWIFWSLAVRLTATKSSDLRCW